MSKTLSPQIDVQEISNQEKIEEELIPLEQLRPLPLVLRESNSDDREDLYKSIKETGLQHPFLVARQPDSDGFVLIAGGNNRLKVVQRLNRESRGELFPTVPCVQVPWPGISSAKVSHLISNDVSHQVSFIERAKAILNFIDDNSDLPIDRTTSARGVSRFFAEHGFPLYRTTYSAMKYAVEFLNKYLPSALASSFSTSDVKHTQLLERKLKSQWLGSGQSELVFYQLFAEVASSCDHEDLEYDTFDGLLSEHIEDELQYIREQSETNPVLPTTSLQADVAHESGTPRSTTKPISTTLDSNETNELAPEIASSTQDSVGKRQIRDLAMELAREFNLEECLVPDENEENRYLVVELPPDGASPTARLIWEYLANFSGVCEMTETELIPHLNSDSRLYCEYQDHGSFPSFQTAKELDLSVCWYVESKSFELLLTLWQAVFEQIHTERTIEVSNNSFESESSERVAA